MPIGGVVSGFGLFFEGASLLWRQRTLWPLAAVPFALSLLLVGSALSLLGANLGELHGWMTSSLPALEAGAWYTWLWVGPLQLLFWLFELVLLVIAAVIAVVLGLLVANVVAAPFLDALSQRVERLESGAVWDSGASGLSAIWGDAARTVSNELRRVAFFVAVWGTLFVLGVVIPGGQLVAPPLLTAFTLLFLPLDYAGPLLDRRQVPFRERRSWVRKRLPLMTGFGGAAFLICLVPGLNLLLLPVLVTGGTLLALRHPPAAMRGLADADAAPDSSLASSS